MANPTTNYGFVLPSPTDLVTDLPADFDVALQGVDTRLKALQPGTTLGDLAYSSATANTNTRLGIGSTGNVLTVSGGVPVWAAPSGLSFSDYTPTYTNITIGNGTVVARYAQSDKFVFASWSFTLGSTSSYGSNARITLPVTATSTNFVGTGYGLDAGTNEVIGQTVLFSTTTMNLYVPLNGSYGSTQAGSTFPWTWTTNDKIILNIVYEAA